MKQLRRLQDCNNHTMAQMTGVWVRGVHEEMSVAKKRSDIPWQKDCDNYTTPPIDASCAHTENALFNSTPGSSLAQTMG